MRSLSRTTIIMQRGAEASLFLLKILLTVIGILSRIVELHNMIDRRG